MWSGLVIFFGFPLPLHISAAAVISQDVEATGGLRFPTAVVQWLSSLCCSEDIAVWFQVISFDMLLLRRQREVPLPRRRSESVWYLPACLPVLLLLLYIEHINQYSTPVCGGLPRSQTINSSLFFHSTIRKVTFCWRVSYCRKCEREQSGGTAFISPSPLKIACSSSSSHLQAVMGPSLS